MTTPNRAPWSERIAPCYHYRGPTIDHSGLSQSGRVSKRARAAWEKREFARLFAGVTSLKGETPQPSEAESLIRHAEQLEALAARGMSVRKFTKAAKAIRARASALKGGE